MHKYHSIVSMWFVKRHLVVVLLFVTVIIAVYGQVKDFEFISYDDPLYVSENLHVQQGLTPETLAWSFTEATKLTNYWVPLTWISILSDYELFGMNAGGYHLTNVFFHILNTVLLFWVLDRLTGCVWRSAFVAALFALHPLHVESVAWVTERKDMLSTFFWMLTLLGYVRYVERPGALRYIIVFLCMLCGLMSKPMIVTLPFILLLFDFWPLSRLQADFRDVQQRRILAGLVREKIPFFILIAVFSIMAFLTQAEGGAVKSLADYPMGVRAANALTVYLKYIEKVLWPFDLAFLYPHPGPLPIWQTVTAGAILAVITWMAFKYAKPYPYIAVGWLWYLGTLVPVNGLVVIGPHVMADRYTYIPLIGLFVSMSWGITDLVRRWPHRRVVIAILVVVILTALSVISWFQVGHWRNDKVLYQHAIEVTENNLAAYLNLGVALQKEGRLELAEKNYANVIRLDPDDPSAYSNLGAIAQKRGRMVDAVRYYRTALEKDPQNVVAYNNLGNVMAATGKEDDAAQYYLNALRIDPVYLEAYTNLGHLYFGQKRYDQAADCYSTVLAHAPYDAKAHNDLGSALAMLGRKQKAIALFREALRLDPGFAVARRNLEATAPMIGK